MDFTRSEELFTQEYAYFSSTSPSWVAHAARYTENMIQRFQYGPGSLVIELGSNDGYLLKHFLDRGIDCLGIEPTASTADEAERLGISVLRDFFSESLGLKLAVSGRQADLIIGNNVYAHVPDINDFTKGLKQALKPNGIITLEFPYLLRLIQGAQFDTIYHEHYSYLSLNSVIQIFQAADLRVWDVSELSTHGGSLRIYGCHAEDDRPESPTVNEVLSEECRFGLRRSETYQGFQAHADRIKDDFLVFLIDQRRAGKQVIGYGAAAKGNSLINYAGVRADLLPCVCDAAASKQGKYLPGSRIPIVTEAIIKKEKPNFILILPWNLRNEIMDQLKYIKAWGGQFVTAIPQLDVV